MSDIMSATSAGLLITLAGIVFQAGIGWAFLWMIRREVESLRDGRYEHAQMLTRHDAAIEDHERRIGTLEGNGDPPRSRRQRIDRRDRTHHRHL